MTATDQVERLRGLIERLEKLEWPSREADADIYIALHIPPERVGRIDRLGGCVGWWPKYAPYVSAIDVPEYTASLDAAIALVERVLRPVHPNMTVNLRGTFDSPNHIGWWRAEITWPSHERAGHSPQAAIALVLATLRALQEQSDA